MAADSEDKALKEFLQAFEDRKKKEAQRVSVEMRQVERKRRILAPIKELLDKFVDLGLVVSDARIGAPNVPLNTTQVFSFYEGVSSPAWSPGVSLFLDHPAEIEIAIPNDIDADKMGVVCIRMVSMHKDRQMLEKKFTTVESAKDAIARFLGKNALAIKKDPRKKSSDTTDNVVLEKAPNEPPEPDKS